MKQTVYIDKDDLLIYYFVPDARWSQEVQLTKAQVKRIKAAEKEFEKCQTILDNAYQKAKLNLQ
jgi:hypothetical protein